MSGEERPTGTLTLVFSDMEGSTRLARALGDGWPALLARHRQVLREAVEAEDGTVVDCQGDSMFAVFHTGEPARTVDGGYAGVDVSHAARLCAAGQAARSC
jgi:class 3 adenylate cyclase